MTERIFKTVKEEFCQPGTEWVIMKGKSLKVCPRQIHPIPKAWASFIVQTLKAPYNHPEFIVKGVWL